MQFGLPINHKPPIGTPLDRTSSLVSGMVWFAPCWENGGTAIADLIGGVNLTASSAFASAPTWSLGTRPKFGAGPPLAATSSNFQATLPAQLKIQVPITLVMGFRVLGNMTGGGVLFGLYLNSSNAADFYAATIRVYDNSHIGLGASTTSNYNSTPAILATTAGVDYIVTAVFNSTTYTTYVYNSATGAISTLTASWANSPLSATYTSTALIGFGAVSGHTANPNFVPSFGAVYNRALTAGEAAAWGVNPWQVFVPRQQVALISTAPPLVVSPGGIYAANPNNVTLTLTGTGTNWGGGTVFTLSGVSGVTKVSQSVASTTSATVVVTTGTGYGSLSVTDGINTATTYVNLPVLSISPATIPSLYIGNYTLTLMGTGTNWGGGTVFTLSGVSGVTKVSQSVASATSATVVVTTAAGTGTLLVTDGESTGTATVAQTSQSSPAFLTPYVSKSGQLAVFVCTQNNTSATSATGTVSVNRNSTSLTTTNPQSGWIGKSLLIAGDSSQTSYAVVGGYANSWTISPAYAGSSNAMAASATLVTVNPLQVIQSITSAPTINVQFGGVGSAEAVHTWGPIWSPISQKLPLAAWQLQCGPVSAIVVQNGGQGYSASPSASTSGGGGSGLTFGTPVVTGGVTSYAVGSGGSGYTTAPTVTVHAPSLTIIGTLTSGSTSVTGISSTAGLIAGMSVFASGANENTIASITSSSAIVMSQPATLNGSNSLTIVGKPAEATATISGGAVTAINVFVPGSGYSAGSPPTVSLSGGGYSVAASSLTCTVSNVIASVPVTGAGSGYTSPPTISITDSTGSGAVAVAVMGGVQPSDVVTYSAARQWVSTANGYPAATTSAAVANYSGQLETGVGGVYNFGLSPGARTIQAGSNLTGPAGNWSNTFGVNANWMPRNQLSNNTNISSAMPDGRPLMISGTAASPTSFRVAYPTSSKVDSNGPPVASASGINNGYWTFVADELTPSNPTNVALTAIVAGTTVTSTFTEGLSTTGVTSVTLGSGGSGYIDVPVVSFLGSGTGAAAYAQINANGNVIGVTLASPGEGYITAPQIVFSGGGGSGATATATKGPVLVGRTWRFTVAQGTAPMNFGLNLNVWKTTGGSYPYTLTNECLFSPATSAAAYPGIPSRATALSIDSGMTNWVTSPTPKYPSVLRFMGAVLQYGGLGSSNVVDPCDIKSPNDFSWNPRSNLTGAALAANPTGQRTINITAIRTYAISAAGYPAGWNVAWSSPNVYLSNPGTGGSTAVTPNSGWSGSAVYGSSSAAGPYVVSPTSIAYWNSSGPSTSWYVGEMVCSAPHNLKSGQQLTYSATPTFSVSEGASNTVAGVLQGGIPIIVTGPTTFAFTAIIGAIAGTGASMPGGINNVAGSFPVSITATVQIPDQSTIPFEVAAQVAGALPGCDLWANIPTAATDQAVQAIARRCRDNFPPGRKVYVEYGNEHWNTAGYCSLYCYMMGQLRAWSNASPALSGDQPYTQRSAQCHQLFVETFNQPDVNGNVNRGSEIVRLFGSQMTVSGITSAIVTYANSVNAVTPNSILIDAVAVAPYIDMNSDTTSPTAAATVSANGGGTSGGLLPAGTYYAYYTWVDAVSGIETDVGKSVSVQFTCVSGYKPIVTIPSFPTWGAGTANIYLTATNGAAGTETLFATGVTGTTYTLNLATWSSTPPPAYNLMPSTTAAASLLATHWPTSIAYRQSNPWTRSAYLDFYRHGMAYNTQYVGALVSHQAVLNSFNSGAASTTVPALVGYEGGLQQIVPPNVQTGADAAGYYLANQLATDVYYDPAIYDCDIAFFEYCQAGGMSEVCVYELAGPIGITGNTSVDIWPQAIWENQPFGRGDGTTASSGQAVTNKFWGDTQTLEHGNNVAVRMQAFNDWIDQANQFVIPGDVYVTPANGATSVSPRVVIVVEFDEPMLGSTITTSTFTLKLNGNSVSGTVVYNPVTWAATFTPTVPLNRYEAYIAQVSTGVTNAEGIALSNPINWTFVTGSGTAGGRWFSGMRRPTPRLTV